MPRALSGMSVSLVALAVATSLGAVAVEAIPCPAGVRFSVVLAFFCTGPGTALLGLFRRAEPHPALVTALSLAIIVLAAQILLWAHAFSPTPATYAAAGACLSAIFAGFAIHAPGIANPGTERDERFARSRRLVRDRLGQARRAMPTTAVHLVVVGVAIGAWVSAVDHVELGRVSGYGLLPALPATFYASLAVLAAGFAWALSRSAPIAVLALYAFALVLVLHGVAPVAYPEPRYAWTYKHLGVTAYIARHGSTDRSIDIYQNWPGFFALNAWLVRATGLGAFTYAPWAEVFFNATYVVALQYLLAGLTKDRRVVWSAIWLFVLGNWIGQDYYSPQGFVFLLGAVLLALCLRCTPAPGRPRTRLTRWLDRQRRQRSLPWLDPPGEGPLAPAPALLAAGLIDAAIIISHQLTPFLLVVSVAAFAFSSRRIPVAVIVAMLVATAAWVVPAIPLLNAKFNVFQFSPFETPRPPGFDARYALPGIQLASATSLALILALVCLAAAGFIRRWRAGSWDLPLVATAAAPLVLLAAVSYSGEGVLRIYLFALPWLCFLAAAACLPGRRLGRPRIAYGMLIAVVSAVLTALNLPAFFGREKINLILPSDVAVERWYETNAPPGAGVAYLAPNVPNRFTARYAALQVPGGSFGPALTLDPRFRGHLLGPADIPNLESLLRAMHATAAYFMISPSMTSYVSLFGVLPTGSEQRLIAAIERSPDFQLVYDRRGALLFRLVTPGQVVRRLPSI